jgi:hypothetical protein
MAGHDAGGHGDAVLDGCVTSVTDMRAAATARARPARMILHISQASKAAA